MQEKKNGKIKEFFKNDKNRERISEISMLLFSFFIIPVASVLACISVGEPVFAITLSQIAWFHDKLWVVFLWGIISIFPLIFSIYKTCKVGKFSKTGTIVFTLLGVLSLIILMTGISISSAKGETLRLIHVGFCTAGFLMFLVIILCITGAMWRKNKHAFILSACMDAFMLISGLFMVFEARSFSNNNVSALAEAYCFMVFNVVSVLNYFMLKLIPAPKKNSEDATVETTLESTVETMAESPKTTAENNEESEA